MAKMLLAQAQAWMADPANEATKRALVTQLQGLAEKAGGAAGRLSARLAREVERRKVSVAAWERDLMSLRYEIADMAPGPVRDAAIDAYVAQASAAVHLIDDPGRPEKARDVMRALEAEQRMLAVRAAHRRRAAPGRRRGRGRAGRVRRARRRPSPGRDERLGRDRLRRLVRRARGGRADRRPGARDRPPRDRRRRDVGVGGAAALPRAARPARLRRPGARGHLAPHPPPQPADALLRLRHVRLPAAVRDDVRPLRRRVPARPDHRGGGGGGPHHRRDVHGADRHRGRRVADVGPEGAAAPRAAAAQELRGGGAPAVPRRGPPLLGRPRVGDAPLLVGLPGGRPRPGRAGALRRPLVAVGRPDRLPRPPRARRGRATRTAGSSRRG